MSRKVLITKMTKGGFGKTVGSAFGFGSWTFSPTAIEVEVDPPIDITTPEGREVAQKLSAGLSKMTLTALNDDVALACKQSTELIKSLTQRELVMNTEED